MDWPAEICLPAPSRRSDVYVLQRPAATEAASVKYWRTTGQNQSSELVFVSSGISIVDR